MKSKQLKLKPANRDKRRYILINEKSNSKIEQAILEYIGILGYAKSAYMKITPSPLNKTIGSCLREELNNIHAALTLAGIKVEKVSNTIKSLSK